MASQPIANPTIDWTAKNLALEYQNFVELCDLMFIGPHKGLDDGEKFSYMVLCPSALAKCRYVCQICEKAAAGVERLLCAIQGWPVAFTGGICHRYLPVNTGMDNTPKSGVYRHLLAFINILLISLQITLLTVLATYYIIHGHHSTIFAAYA